MAQKLPVQMTTELLDDMGFPPGLELSDTRPGPQQKPNVKDDPYGDIGFDFFKPLPGAKRALQTRTPPPPPPLPGTSSRSSIPEEPFSLSESASASGSRWISPTQLFTMPPSDTSTSK
eukprot:2799064-Alexandrium_andersonii.AAC.1